MGEVRHELGIGYELLENKIAEGKAVFRITGIVGSRHHPAVGHLAGAVQEILRLRRKEPAEESGLKL